MFGSKKRQADVQRRAEEYERGARAAQAEREALDRKRRAEAEHAKWDRVVRGFTSRGQDGYARDRAIQLRDKAQEAIKQAETDALNAKLGR